ncbi:Cytochrome oxidase complex assembly protein 1 [Tenacibaculum sp. MAR_2009_124]|uniref:cytochrome c oxidase assembly factor Coa1 family protein n=1 Tax=Tenacibaculum sp. MAR_2009_124 TaxID=1250059 RepID=UPI000899A144|nr:cytochrome c oxidase assembly factor Coa1 family protein [Tenacibaculum sp. MAR_2009_124]SEB40010.1 Cytochrome oxidase complex assembly protein 1 [Tenacibaculum sp. MAR_2009_124]
MNQRLERNWWKRNLKWLISFCIIFFLLIFVVSTEFGKIGADIFKAYSDTELYEDALDKVKTDPKIFDLLGKIEPIDKMSILEGEVAYSNNSQTVHSTIRIIGSKGKAVMDIIAHKTNGVWNYSKVNIRIKKPIEKKQTIEIISNNK